MTIRSVLGRLVGQLAQVRRTIAEGRLDDTFLDVTCEPPRAFSYGGTRRSGWRDR